MIFFIGLRLNAYARAQQKILSNVALRDRSAVARRAAGRASIRKKQFIYDIKMYD